MHIHTPTLSAIDPRGLAVREVAYHRRVASESPESRVTHQLYDEAGRLARQRDPRLFALLDAPSNLSTTYSLSNQPLCSDSVDAGWQVDLPGPAGQVIESWDQRGWHRHTEHDSSLRPVAMFEQGIGEVERCAERIQWGAATDEEARHNRCGQPIRQDDPAGSRLLSDYGMSAAVLVEIRHFLSRFDPPDWPLVEAERDRLLEPGEGAQASWSFLPAGELSHQTDAQGHTRHFTYDRSGQLHSVGLQRAGQPTAETLVNAIEYNAFGQIEQERAGNGMRTSSDYDPANGRLTNLDTQGPAQGFLQKLSYGYDPVGNISEIADAALPIQHFANQRIEPVRRFTYDTLYQLISATGWETATPSLGPALPGWQGFGPPDASRWCNYTETYYYDEAGNLLQRLHHGAVDDTLTMGVASHSNRSVKTRTGPPGIDVLFDARGNLLELQPGQALQWNGRNQLAQVTQVARIDGADDIERYVYDSAGARLRKYREFTAKSIVHTPEVRYLPGIELHANSATGERLQVISVQAGRCSVRLLHWDSPPPAGLDNDQWRYCFDDHLGSSAFEVDAQAKTISQEVYYPFGGTAWLAGRHEVETSYKTIRYSGKERDATGLYYYGFRYYAPWLQRWLTPDPAGSLDGLNRYQMVGSNPSSFYDWQGTIKVPVDIFIGDIVSFLAKDIGTGWFEELVWNEEQSTFLSVGPVYGRSLKVFEGERSEWAPSEFGQAITFFRDQNNKLRLFANMHFQHMGIQPGMGLPEFAGVMKRDSSDSSKFIINNHSGHYKPDSSIDVEAMIHEIAPQQQSVRYIPIPESSSFDATLRLDSIDSPEEYSRLVSAFKRDFKGLIVYLKEQGVWDAAKERFGNSEGINIIFKMEETGRTAQQIYDEEDKLRNARVMASSEEPVSNAATTTLPQAQAKPKKRSFFQKLFG